jgi:hypothetical protein
MNIALYDPRDHSFRTLPSVTGMPVEEFRAFSLYFTMQSPNFAALLIGWVDPDEGDYMGVIFLGPYNESPPEDLNDHFDRIERFVKNQ